MKAKPNRNKTRWTTRIRVERRNNLTSYAVLFTNGKSLATLRGAFSRLPITADVLQSEAFTAAIDWMAHLQPNNGAPKPKLKRLHYIRNQTRSNNHKRREHRMRRAA
jgi:hypothetical protein